MGCCNEKRARWGKGMQPFSAAVPSDKSGALTSELPLMRTVAFEYVGETGLSVLGPVTRRHYRFGNAGARVAVDLRDVPYLSGVPTLRRLREASGGKI